jgi:hypothetical protein
MDMKVQVLNDKISTYRFTYVYIPFAVFINNRAYEGTLLCQITNIGEKNISYELSWTDDEPNINKELLIDHICSQL